MGGSMHWKTIRLELASTPEFPAGSAGRAYLLRLPIDDNGMLDAAGLHNRPEHATVRRFWPSEPDPSGHIERTASRWRMRCDGEANQEAVSLIKERPIQLGRQVIVTEADGRRLPFRGTAMRRPC